MKRHPMRGLGAECITAEQKSAAESRCRATNHLEFAACYAATLAVCPEAPPPPPPPVPPASKTFTGHSFVTGGGYGTKLPVPEAAAAPVVPPPRPPEEEGIPTWLWVVGGAAVLGGAAFAFARRKKGAA